MMTVSVAKTVAEVDELVPEWLALLESIPGPGTVFHEPAVVRVLLADEGDPVSPYIVTVRENGRLQCVAPFYLRTRPVPLRFSVFTVASFRAQMLRLFGDDIILSPSANEDQTLEQVFDALSRMPNFDLIWIYGLPLGQHLSRFLTTGRLPRQFRTVDLTPLPEKSHGLILNQTFEAYVEDIRKKPGFPGKTIRRFWRDMKERCAVTCISRADQVPQFLADLNAVYNASWQGRTYGAQIRNTGSEITRLQKIADLGHLRSYVLTCDQSPIAFVLGYQCRGRFTYYETGYDSAHSSLSPGSILTHAAIEDLFSRNPPQEVDFGFGDAGYKRTFGNNCIDVTSSYIVLSFKWKTLLAMQSALNAVYRRAYGVAIQLRVDTRLRRLLKRQA